MAYAVLYLIHSNCEQRVVTLSVKQYVYFVHLSVRNLFLEFVVNLRVFILMNTPSVLYIYLFRMNV